ASAIFVGVYEPTKQKLLKMFPENLSALPHFVVKQRMQTGQFTSASAAVRLIAAKEGFKGLYAAKRELNDPENAIIGAFADYCEGRRTSRSFEGYWTKSAVDRDWRFNFFGVFERTKRLLAQGRPTVGEDTKQD
ncbi:hypothetical protein ABKV19_008074, partial [Rosa sericea]